VSTTDQARLRAVVAANLRYAVAQHGTTIAALAEAGGWHRRTLERWLDPEHPSTPAPRKRHVLELLLNLPAGWLAAEHEEVPA
jgi:lambda repressor-like predicted transcriptional regulator